MAAAMHTPTHSDPTATAAATAASSAAASPAAASAPAASASTPLAAKASALQQVIVIRIYSPPPPPPRSKIVPSWTALYFALGLTGVYALVMAAVVFSLSGSSSGGEATPLKSDAKGGGVGGAPYARRVERPVSWKEVEVGGGAMPEVDKATRAAFVRKVYAVLATQLLATVWVIVGIVYLSFDSGDALYPTDFGYWVAGSYSLPLLLLLLLLFTLCFLHSAKNSYPANYIALSLFTCLMGLSVSQICVSYYALGLGQQILLAFFLTSATFVLLTLFTVFSTIDFDFLGPLLCLGIFVLIFWSLIMSIFFSIGGYSSSWTIVFAIFGSLLFIGFIIYDTNKIIRYLGVDDYIIAAIELYLDVINLFLYLLQILTICGQNR